MLWAKIYRINNNHLVNWIVEPIVVYDPTTEKE